VVRDNDKFYLRYINNFRAIATVFVVFNHSVPALQWTDDIELDRLCKIIYSNGALFFTFIAGFLFQHLAFKFNYRSYLVTRFKLVVSPYLLISIPAVLAWTFMFQKHSAATPPDFYEWSAATRILYLYATGLHLAPVWFIPMIVLFYLAAPLFYWMDRYPRSYWILPALIYLSYLVPRDFSPATSAVHFLSVYVFGMFCSRYKEQVITLAGKLMVPLLVAFVALVLYEWMYTYEIQGYLNYWNKMVGSVILIALLARYDSRIGDFIKPLANVNFSIFFLHAYVLAGIKILWMGRPAVSLPLPGNPFMHFLFASAVVLICAGITLVLKRIFGRYSRNVIGS